MSSLMSSVQEALKSAMKAGARERVGAIRAITAAVKQYEVDHRDTPDDAQILSLLDKMTKQRRESIAQFAAAGRDDLVAKEAYELEVIAEFLPPPFSDEEIDDMVSAAVAEVGAESIRDMGKVMGLLKPVMTGRADMAAVSARIKAHLSA